MCIRDRDYAVQNFAVFAHMENLKGKMPLPEYALRLIDTFFTELRRYPDRIGIVRSFRDIEKNMAEGRMSALLTMEEGAICQGKLEYLRIFYELGAVSYTHLDSVLKILEEKAAAGVDVRVLYDGMNSFSNLPHDYPKELEARGVRCRIFNPIRPAISTSQNNRDHRKILVIDGHTAFTGGVNLADEYINRKVRFGHWKDNAVHSGRRLFLPDLKDTVPHLSPLDDKIFQEYEPFCCLKLLQKIRKEIVSQRIVYKIRPVIDRIARPLRKIAA